MNKVVVIVSPSLSNAAAYAIKYKIKNWRYITKVFEFATMLGECEIEYYVCITDWDKYQVNHYLVGALNKLGVPRKELS